MSYTVAVPYLVSFSPFFPPLFLLEVIAICEIGRYPELLVETVRDGDDKYSDVPWAYMGEMVVEN